eukprot:CAMPEP_0204371590 /NCGR_PEP_ID=MMETSP0469-20131031/46608_1 /ASSEMBLY_ACC=CAM_ASM_000384 /TAXON_ID=2969 /ORGANISM="Oxyrrhis marina" /LENGTH=116 /DNA_ID=CAMNT_0051361721 /DNA_START=38 /DNA_END=388 /DNA_ORIENTATION=-
MSMIGEQHNSASTSSAVLRDLMPDEMQVFSTLVQRIREERQGGTSLRLSALVCLADLSEDAIEELLPLVHMATSSNLEIVSSDQSTCDEGSEYESEESFLSEGLIKDASEPHDWEI